MDRLTAEAEQRLDSMFDQAFSADHPAMHDYVALKFELKELRAERTERASVTAEIGELREEVARRNPHAVATELRALAAWVRTPGNIDREDAIDCCARALENRARALVGPS